MIVDNLIKERDYNWIDVGAPHEEDLNRLNSEFELPYLLVLDTLKPEHLPKFELTEEGHFLMLRCYDREADIDATSVQDLTRKIAIFIKQDKLISIHRVDLFFLKKLKDRCHKGDIPRTIQGFAHMLILSVIRTYEEPLTALQDQYDEFEELILEKKKENPSTAKLYKFRRRLFILKRMLKQTEEALYQFRDFYHEHPSMLQDMRENCNQLYFRLDEISDNFEHLFQLYISLNDQRANEVMRILTVFSTILLPLNFIASFYGMNFVHMPGLEGEYSVHFLTALMGVMSIAVIWVFKRKGWFRSNE